MTSTARLHTAARRLARLSAAACPRPKNIVLCALCVLQLMTFAFRGALADCVEAPRTLQLGQNDSVRLKSYLCSDGQTGGPLVRFETTRLSDLAASSLILGRPLPALMQA